MSVVKTIKCQLETITPVHIGTGNEIPSTDYLLFEQSAGGTLAYAFSEVTGPENLPERAFVVYKLREYIAENPQEGNKLIRKLCQDQSFILNDNRSYLTASDMSFWYYSADVSDFVIEQLQEENFKAVDEVIKLPSTEPGEFDSIYIPGTTIKGGLRTALAYFIAYKNLNLLAHGIGSSSGNPKRSDFEKVAFQSGNQNLGDDDKLADAQVDVLRCLEISDSDSTSATTETIAVNVVKTATFPNRGALYFKRWASFYEAIKSHQIFGFEVRVKSDLINHLGALKQLGWQGNTENITIGDIPKLINEFSLKTIQHELDYLNTVPQASSKASSVRTKYNNLKSWVTRELNNSNSKTCYLCIGRGAGRHKKTVELAIDKVTQKSDERHSHYGGKRDNGSLGCRAQGSGELGRGDVRTVVRRGEHINLAPVSRLFIMSDFEKAESPLGWVKLIFGAGFEAAAGEVIPVPKVQ